MKPRRKMMSEMLSRLCGGMAALAVLLQATGSSAANVPVQTSTTPSGTAGDTALWPLVVYFALALLLVAFMIGFSAILGQRHKERATGEPYESGIASTGTARIRLSVQFYVVAMIFVIFDLEAAFIFAWAIAVREVGWAGYIEVVVFIGILLAALVYLWRLGALSWGPSPRSALRGQQRLEAQRIKAGE